MSSALGGGEARELSSLVTHDRYARAAWSRVAEPGDPRAHELVTSLGAVEGLRRVVHGTDPRHETFRMRVERLDLERDLEHAARVGARVVVPTDDEWPGGVDDLPYPPVCLWVRGSADLSRLARRSVAIVGARASTSYGDHVAGDLAAGLAERGYVVVSGAAFGIDGAAHRGALAVDGCTVAVLAGGVDRPYPVAHATLLKRIAETGAIMSEVAPGSAPTRPRFLLRNRLIASMTAGVVVVEAGLRSGSLNTARTAAEVGRPVGVVPGPITSMASAGCHQARRDGYAELVTDVAEVVDLVGEMGVDAAPHRSGTVEAVDRLGYGDRQVLEMVPVRVAAGAETIAVAAGVCITAAVAALGRLELEGYVRRDASGWRKSSSPAEQSW